MKKDIEIPKVEGVGVAIAREFDEGEEVFNAYLINFNAFALTNVLVSTKGYGMNEDQKIRTTTFSHFLGDIPPHSYKLIEPITHEVLVINNEFFVTYYVDGLIYDKKYVFLPGVVAERNFIDIKLLEREGVLIK